MAVSDEELISILRKSEQDAQSWQDLELLTVRTKANDYYDRKPQGDEEEGQSKVITSEFADTVESVMPSMMRVFASGDDVVEFTPIEQQDEQAAREASQYVPHVLMRENDGFRIMYWWFKDALMSRLGVVTVDVEDVDRVSTEPVQAWTEEQMAMAMEVATEQGATKVEFDVQPDPVPPPAEPQLDEMGQPMLMPEPAPTFSGTLRRTRTKKRVVVDNVAPEDLLISPANVRDIDQASYAGYRKQVTASDLRRLGLSEDDIDGLSANHTGSPEEDQRQGGMNYAPPRKDSERRLWLVVAYVRVDSDEDGISEMERVVYAHAGGTAGAIIERMEWEDGECPIACLTPILMPHTMVGRSLFDQVEDLQDVGTALTRGMLDNVYMTNRPRPAINGRVDILSVLDVTPGRPIQVSGNENPANAIQWSQVPSIIQPALVALEHMDAVRENRTGVTRYNQGLDANSLNKTASGINNIMSAAQQRQELMARVMANTGVSRLMRLIYRAAKRCATGEPVSYYGGQDWNTCNPAAWPDDMHLEVSVGTGTGNKVQEIQNLLMVGQGQEKLIQAQGGVDGPLVTKEHIANTFRKMVQAAGFKATQQFVASEKDIEASAGQPPQQPPQDPLVQAEQIKAQASTQAKAAELQLKEKQMMADYELKQKELLIKDKELDIKAAELALAREQLQAERERTAVDSYHKEADRAVTANQAAMASMPQPEADAPDAEDQGMMALADGLRAQGEGIAQGLQALAQAVLSEQEIVRGPDGRVAGARRRPPMPPTDGAI